MQQSPTHPSTVSFPILLLCPLDLQPITSQILWLFPEHIAAPVILSRPGYFFLPHLNWLCHCPALSSCFYFPNRQNHSPVYAHNYPEPASLSSLHSILKTTLAKPNFLPPFYTNMEQRIVVGEKYAIMLIYIFHASKKFSQASKKSYIFLDNSLFPCSSCLTVSLSSNLR